MWPKSNFDIRTSCSIAHVPSCFHLLRSLVVRVRGQEAGRRWCVHGNQSDSPAQT